MICYECEREIQNGIITAKDAIALNKKILGRQVTLFFCAECLSEYLQIALEDLPDIVERYKEQGCKLF
jgi:hypothetical protein